MSPQRRHRLATVALIVALTGVYANHFDNGFQFDDSHAIHSNQHITSLRNAGRFFVDATTFSASLSHQGYRPLLALGFAVDHAVAGGLHTWAFHLHSFLLFIALILCVRALFARLLRAAFDERAATLASVGASLYALHPVCAETVNYIVQRGDIIDALGVVASLALYLRSPRPIGWHLLPMLVASFGKEASIMYAPILGLYVFLHSDGSLPVRVRTTLRQAGPAFALIIAFFALHQFLQPPTADVGGLANPRAYWRAQPFVLAYEVKCLLLPTTLTADTDMTGVDVMSWRFFAGLLFLLALIVTIVVCGRARGRGRSGSRTIAFGLGWFLIANLPTSLIPLGEVTNDHRMFFPYVGLVLASTTGLGLGYAWLARRWPRRAPTVAAATVALALALEGVGTFARNRVWDTPETLWRDVTEKSPRNGRGLMNYGVALMEQGRLAEALALYERARPLLSNYAYLETNLGIVKGVMGGRDAEAEAHFRRAVQLIREPVAQRDWAWFLIARGRLDEARGVLEEGLRRQSEHWPMRAALLEVFARLGAWDELRRALDETQAIFPDRWELRLYREALAEAEGG